MRVREAAARLEVSPATVDGLVAAGNLRCHRVGLGRGCIRISEARLAEFLAGVELVMKAAPAPVRRIKLKHPHLP